MQFGASLLLLISFMKETHHPIIVVALGDSTTAGTPGFESPLEAPPDGKGNVQSQYAYWLNRAHPEWRILNRGINGERSDQIRARFERDVLQIHPQAVIIIAGVNDIYQGRSAESVENQLQWMYEKAGAEGLRVVAGSILPYNTSTPDQNARMHEVNEWIRAFAKNAPNFRFCDTRRAVAHPQNLDRLRGSPDGLHPDVDGYRRMAEALAPIVESLISPPSKARSR